VRAVLIAVPLVLLAIIGLLLLNHHSKPKAAVTTSSQSKSSTTSSTVSVTHISSSTKRYDSTNLSLGFDYPSDWSVSDPGSGKLNVISPMLTLKSSDGQAVKARIVMSAQSQQPTIAQFAANTAVAPLASQKITYKQPTPNQRAKTYLTFVSYAGSSSSIDALYITGDNGYTAGQYVPGSDVAKDDPLISVSFYGCSDTTCSNYGKAIAIAANSWSDTNLSKPLINLLQSFVID